MLGIDEVFEISGKIFHKPEKVIPEENIYLSCCSSKCPNHKCHDGEGYCDEWITCDALGCEIWNWSVKIVDGFPETCPLKNIKDTI